MMMGSVRASVLVQVPPEQAFRMFTEEIDEWYRVDEYTVPDPSRTVALRIEPPDARGRGGRFVAIHDAASGEGDVLGEIRTWKPPAGFAFVDGRGCEVEVSFVALSGGTLVSIEQRGLDRLPREDADRAGRFGWHTVASWFAARAGRAPSPVRGGLVPYLFYEDAGTMMDWYARVFGFVEVSRWCAPDGTVQNGEMAVGDTELWLDGGGPRHFDRDGKRAAAWIGVLVDDLDAVYERVCAAGVDVDPPEQKPYGVRMLSVEDPEGYTWGFMKRRRA